MDGDAEELERRRDASRAKRTSPNFSSTSQPTERSRVARCLWLCAAGELSRGLKALLATTGTRRSSALPDVPTFSESGVSGFEAGLWFGLNTTAGTPRATIARLNREVVRIMGTPEMRDVLAKQGIDPTPSSAQAFDAFITQDTAKWARVVKAAGVRAE